MRAIGDPLADQVIDTLVGNGGIDLVNHVFRSLIRDDAPIPADVPAEVKNYFQQTDALPAWSDLDQIRCGEEVFNEYGLHFVVALFCASLPKCYACAKGAHVLALTARLQTDPRRRVVETGQFLIDVMAPGGLAGGGKGLRTAQKVRLMHAAVRHMCRTDPNWQPAWDTPVNQEDLAGTLMAFATVTLDAVATFGIALSPPQQEAYFHAWRTVGYIVGVQPELLPESVGDGRALMKRILDRQVAPSTAGMFLTEALIRLMTTVVPGRLYNPVPAHLIRLLVGDHIADIIAVPRVSGFDRQVFRAASEIEYLANRRLGRDRRLDALFEVFNRKLLEGLIGFSRGSSRSPFKIPQALADGWRLRQTQSPA